MSWRTVIGGALSSTLTSMLVVAGLWASAWAQGQQPLSFTADDPGLKWGPCPDFMPKGCEIAILHGDPAKDNADVFFKLPPNSTAPHHWHTSAERMVLVAGELHLTFDGHKPVVLKPGTYAYGPAKLPHIAECRSAGPCVLFIAFEQPVDAVPSKTTGR